MKLLSYIYKNKEYIGVLSIDEKTVMNYSEDSMLNLIENFNDEILKSLKELEKSQAGIKIEDIKIVAPIKQTRRGIICLGKNYKDHVLELSSKLDSDDIPKEPIYFSKLFDKANGLDDVIDNHSDITKCQDYECELAVIIGKEGKDIPSDEASSYIFGYTILNDISARDLQQKHKQWFKSKSLDGSTIMGPYILLADGLEYPPKLDIKSYVNGELRQNSNTSNMMFDIDYVINDFSKGITLKKGDVISTGTPKGVGMGFEPPRYLKSGDEVVCYIESIGKLKNKIK
ncbi:MAG: fumarylacetoacetate hydrolase family protein [Clostridiaceae bacterium]